MQITRKTFLRALAGLPFIGKIFASASLKQEPVAPIEEPPVDLDACIKQAFANMAEAARQDTEYLRWEAFNEHLTEWKRYGWKRESQIAWPVQKAIVGYPTHEIYARTTGGGCRRLPVYEGDHLAEYPYHVSGLIEFAPDKLEFSPVVHAEHWDEIVGDNGLITVPQWAPDRRRNKFLSDPLAEGMSPVDCIAGDHRKPGVPANSLDTLSEEDLKELYRWRDDPWGLGL